MAKAMCLCVPTNSMQQAFQQPRLLAGAWGKDEGRMSSLRATVRMPQFYLEGRRKQSQAGRKGETWERK